LKGESLSAGTVVGGSIIHANVLQAFTGSVIHVSCVASAMFFAQGLYWFVRTNSMSDANLNISDLFHRLDNGKNFHLTSFTLNNAFSFSVFHNLQLYIFIILERRSVESLATVLGHTERYKDLGLIEVKTQIKIHSVNVSEIICVAPHWDSRNKSSESIQLDVKRKTL
jgi:hypothetical protein